MRGERLTGGYRVANDAKVREKAMRTHDPRHIFYEAMLTCRTYDEYLRKVGQIVVQPATYKSPVTGEMEIRYCRDRRRWIADAA